ncbi:uncharacterized protein LOC124172497 [Ischnura elegans]|uniref:uncharacterized protein LOC124172497 n=1 Tax=Ischnura elegans TaxID=197161 RepID=UPI001ED89034|nr:uncharacterized protein LOC124172497 [Ischnura elegans]
MIWSSATMATSGLAPMASTEDLEEEVSLIPDRSQDEQESKIRNNSSIADTSASNTDGQGDRRGRFISTLNMLEDLLKAEREEEQQGEGSENQDQSFDNFIDVLEKLEQCIKNPSENQDPPLEYLIEVLEKVEQCVKNPSENQDSSFEYLIEVKEELEQCIRNPSKFQRPGFEYLFEIMEQLEKVMEKLEEDIDIRWLKHDPILERFFKVMKELEQVMKELEHVMKELEEDIDIRSKILDPVLERLRELMGELKQVMKDLVQVMQELEPVMKKREQDIDNRWKDCVNSTLKRIKHMLNHKCMRLYHRVIQKPVFEYLFNIMKKLEQVMKEREQDIKNLRKDCVNSTLKRIKHMLNHKCMRLYHRKIQDPIFKCFIEVMKELKEGIENRSTSTDLDLIPVEKVKFLERQWNKMSPIESNRMRTTLFVILTQLQRTMRQPEESPTIQVRKIIQKLLVFVRKTRSDNEYNFYLQRDVANEIWRLNRFNKYRKRIIKEGKIYVDKLSMELIKLNKVLLSSSIEQMVFLWPSLEYYAQERSPFPVHMSRENSDACFQNLTDIHRSCRGNGRNLKDIKWLHLALNEILLEQEEWEEIAIGRLRSRNEGNFAIMDTESIGSILKEALKKTSCLLGLVTDSKVMYEDGGDETCPRLRIEYLDEENCGNTFGKDVIDTINRLVSLNHILLHLEWSLHRFIEDYVWARESEEDAEHDQNICASYFFYENPYILNDIYIPYADAAIVVEYGDDTRKYTMKMFRWMFYQNIRVITDRVPGVDCMPLLLGEAAFRLEKLTDYALAQSRKEKEFWGLKDRSVFEERLKNAYHPGENLWSGVLSIDHLLFKDEEKVLRELASSANENILDNLDRVAEGIVTDSQEGRESWGEKILKVASVELNKSNMSWKKLCAGIIEVFLLMLAPHLYLLDMLTDIHTAYLHFSHNNYLYFGLTVLFVCGPMMAEIISYVIVSLLGGEFRNSFRKGLLNFESLKLLPKSIWSLCYAMNSRSQFGDDLDRFYSELHRLRCVRFEGQPRRRRYKAPLIQAQSSAMMVMNAKLLYKWNMNEALNESAPQLLLQMIIINILIANGEVDGYGTLFGMVVSLTTFAWSLHLYHHKMHYVGLENNFKNKDRLFDFLAHFFIVFGRFVAISCVAALYPMRFLGIAGFYLGLRFIYLYYMSSDKVKYRYR